MRLRDHSSRRQAEENRDGYRDLLQHVKMEEINEMDRSSTEFHVGVYAAQDCSARVQPEGGRRTFGITRLQVTRRGQIEHGAREIAILGPITISIASSSTAPQTKASSRRERTVHSYRYHHHHVAIQV